MPMSPHVQFFLELEVYVESFFFPFLFIGFYYTAFLFILRCFCSSLHNLLKSKYNCFCFCILRVPKFLRLRYCQCWWFFFSGFSFIEFFVTSLECKTLRIVMNFLVLLTIFLVSSLIWFQNDHLVDCLLLRIVNTLGIIFASRLRNYVHSVYLHFYVVVKGVIN